MPRRPLKVFISYKWEDDAHIKWVEKFASDLMAYGINVILDQWEVRLGDSFIDYMSRGIKQADIFLFIVTTKSVAAVEASQVKGGALKFELQMAKARELAGEKVRLICIFREGNKIPSHFRDRRYADFRDDSKYQANLENVIFDLLGKRRDISLVPTSETATNNIKRLIPVRIVLHNGCFLPIAEDNEGRYTDIGYFQSKQSISDMRIAIDNNEIKFPSPLKLIKRSFIEVLISRVNANPDDLVVYSSPNFQKHLLHLREIYGDGISINRAKFDSVINFRSGLFTPSIVKKCVFIEYKRQKDGKYGKGTNLRILQKPIAHTIAVNYSLREGDALEFRRDGNLFWSSKDYKLNERIDISIASDNSTVNKYYRYAFEKQRDSYWLPTSGSLPPYCSICSTP